MEFKGQKGGDAAIGPLSAIDDHSRYLVALEQTGTTNGDGVRERLDYGPGAELRKVNTCGEITIHDTPWRVGVALRRQYVQIQHLDQRILVFYCNTPVREIDLGVQRSTASGPLNPKTPHQV
jgi:hypothetical protein